MKTVNAAIPREALIARIDGHMQQVEQWLGFGDIARAAAYEAKAEAIVELLEIDDCGSVGGFDRTRGQADQRIVPGRERLQWRIEWLRSLPTEP